jgi:hypothetical protein
MIKEKKEQKMKVINLIGAPGSGKSTTMLGMTYQMKMLGLSVENTPEYFKELILEGTDKCRFGGQLMVLAEQNKRLDRCVEKNDFVITDCPLPLIGYYTHKAGGYVSSFDNMSMELFEMYDNVVYFIERTHAFEEEKRNHGDKESRIIEQELPKYLEDRGVTFKKVKSHNGLVDDIIKDLILSNVIKAEQLKNNRIDPVLYNSIKHLNVKHLNKRKDI